MLSPPLVLFFFAARVEEIAVKAQLQLRNSKHVSFPQGRVQ